MPKVLIIHNPVSGTHDPEAARSTFQARCDEQGWECEIVETSADEDAGRITRDALNDSVDLVVAAGGDGTVSATAGGLVESDVPLGIVPLGTGNALAQELGIPTDLDDAISLVLGEHDTMLLDVARGLGRIAFLGVGVGLSGEIMRNTGRESKRRFGMLAYLWGGLKALFGISPRRFRVEIDGRMRQFRASEVMVANSAGIGGPALRWGPDVSMNDGHVNVCVVRARNVFDIAQAVWFVVRGRREESGKVRCFEAMRRVRVDANRALPVEVDGDVVGETPIDLEVLPGALRVVVPRNPERQPELETTQQAREVTRV
ncbi:MAG: diacylglycerol/lipid kinase family protein [Anaerolineae bacterium]